MKSTNKFAFVISFLIGMIILGTVVYHHLEKWTYFDSLYFSVTTIATVGFGDMHPTTYSSKFFTIFYVIFGVSAALYAFTLLAEHYFSNNLHKFDSTFGKIVKIGDTSEGNHVTETKPVYEKINDTIKNHKEELIGQRHVNSEEHKRHNHEKLP
jgi:hypothetical protein